MCPAKLLEKILQIIPLESYNLKYIDISLQFYESISKERNNL